MTQGPPSPLPPPKECRRLRETRSLTQAQVAERVGVTRETVRAWETGRTTPRGRKREAYARFLASLDGTGSTQRQKSEESPVVTVSLEKKQRERQKKRGARQQQPPAPPPPSSETPETPETRETLEELGELGASGAVVPSGAPTAGLDADVGAGAGVGGGGGGGGGGGAHPGPHPEPRPDPDPDVEPEIEFDLEKTLAPEPVPVAALAAEPAPAAEPVEGLTPTQAFDALYAFCAPALVRQTYLLTGRRELAREAVEQAFQLAWQRWPEVAVDRDPAGWVRARAHEHALSPWHRFRPRYRHPEPPPADASARTLLSTLQALPAPYRRTVLLYDGVGLDLPETAAETEASTPAAAGRLTHARERIAARLPDLADPRVLHQRLAETASAERLRAAKPPSVRNGSERRARFWTRAAIAFTVALIGTTTLTLRTAPTHYEPPVAPGVEVQGVPARVAPGPLSGAEVELRTKLRGETAHGPERLVPRAE
ncbi:helix-turn-helix domain-containing protein [Streptomyces sp. MAA16]|uniref:helix-turn-helix domain-containing protein n=1 Tax=Streptomyces sp. MAA16 TaxID=3035116 RepID=UPI002475AE29|nr:helix-turn-helix domain-containing protein [Streptomyces sp. MAA16]MDH6698852.1 DNA-directed RNA polymerase specialized sigma24 family protein [Streptomyces sp. MAA16]